MRLFVYTVLLALLCAVLLAFANCGKNRGPSSPAVKLADGDLAMAEPVARSEPQLTEEDYTLMQMPYAERLAYLERKLKDLVYEMHGIVIDESVSAA